MWRQLVRPNLKELADLEEYPKMDANAVNLLTSSLCHGEYNMGNMRYINQFIPLLYLCGWCSVDNKVVIQSNLIL